MFSSVGRTLSHIITNKKRLSLSTAELFSVMHKYPVAYFPDFSAEILNDTAQNLVLIYERYFHQAAAQVALKLRRTILQ